jgi:predicted enzyme related to lactoylglutathione lyase
MSNAPDYNGDLTLAFQVKDRKASIDWYGKFLGFQLMYDVAEIGWCEMATPVEGGKVSVGFSEVETPKVGQGPVPTFGVRDIDVARKHLEGGGVRFDGETIEIPGMVKLATFFDPDGNTLMFSQTLMNAG